MATLIQGGVLIDGSGGSPIQDALVVIDDGVIQEVGQGTSRVRSGSGDRVIDATGKSIVPGLFDTHVHLCVPMKASDPRARQASPSDKSVSLAAMNGLNNAQLSVMKGITSVRDLDRPHHHDILIPATDPTPHLVPLVTHLRVPGPIDANT